MRPISQKLKDKLVSAPFYQKCCLTKKTIKKHGIKIDFHHAWSYSGRQIDEEWAIMPVWEKKHAYYGDDDSVHNCHKTREYVKYLSLLRVDLEDLKKRLPKADWQQVFNYLESKYKNFKYNG